MKTVVPTLAQGTRNDGAPTRKWGTQLLEIGGTMKACAVWLLRGYKRWISPVFRPSCRYVPTCSEYAMEAVERYGVVRGLALAGWRLLRCHPLAKGGLDPVVKYPTLAQRTRKDGAPTGMNGARASGASFCSKGRTNASVSTCDVVTNKGMMSY